MRVLQVMECTIGGTRRHLRDLTLGLLHRGVEVSVVCAALREPRMREDMATLGAAGAQVHELPMQRAIRPATDAWHLLRLLRVVAGRGFDVIHTHSSKAGALGRVAGWLGSRAARVHTPHTYSFSFEGGAGQGGEHAGPPGLLMGTERVLGRLTHRLIHVSRGELDEGSQLGVIAPDRARVVANGIDPAPFSSPSGGAALRAELGIPPDAPVVGTVGLLTDAKGHDVLVDALARLEPSTHLLLVGHGEREGRLREQAASLGLEHRLHITGWRDDLPTCHDAMDVFALSSRWEGLAYALLEAMAAGLACVSTEVNGSDEALDPWGAEPAGLIVPREDPDALARALSQVLDDEGMAQRLGAAGRARVARGFTVDTMVDATLAVYHEVTG